MAHPQKRGGRLSPPSEIGDELDPEDARVNRRISFGFPAEAGICSSIKSDRSDLGIESILLFLSNPLFNCGSDSNMGGIMLPRYRPVNTQVISERFP
jgi:hypothetical protein